MEKLEQIKGKEEGKIRYHYIGKISGIKEGDWKGGRRDNKGDEKLNKFNKITLCAYINVPQGISPLCVSRQKQ